VQSLRCIDWKISFTVRMAYWHVGPGTTCQQHIECYLPPLAIFFLWYWAIPLMKFTIRQSIHLVLTLFDYIIRIGWIQCSKLKFIPSFGARRRSRYNQSLLMAAQQHLHDKLENIRTKCSNSITWYWGIWWPPQ